MKQFFVILLLVIGAMSLAIPPPDVSTSKTVFADDITITGAKHGITQKFKPETAYLTVWDNHQKTADLCQTKNRPF
jgi:hypothetical protein